MRSQSRSQSMNELILTYLPHLSSSSMLFHQCLWHRRSKCPSLPSRGLWRSFSSFRTECFKEVRLCRAWGLCPALFPAICTCWSHHMEHVFHLPCWPNAHPLLLLLERLSWPPPMGWWWWDEEMVPISHPQYALMCISQVKRFSAGQPSLGSLKILFFTGQNHLMPLLCHSLHFPFWRLLHGIGIAYFIDYTPPLCVFRDEICFAHCCELQHPYLIWHILCA